MTTLRGRKYYQSWLNALGAGFRQRRLRWLERHFSDCVSALDIGGRPQFWTLADWRPRHLTLLNLEPSATTLPEGVEEIVGDGCALGFPDQAFDLAFSNSVIEHVPNQAKFAAESLRVGRRLYCQTPSKWFPVEPHFLALFIHWLPERCFTHFIHRYLTVSGWLLKPNAADTKRLRGQIHLLDKKELERLFPGCRIETETFLGWPKAYIVWR